VGNGLFINPEWPFIGASLDSIVCHGKCTLEIKCPLYHRSEDVFCAVSNAKNFCLKKDADVTSHLDPDHAYYYQVQMQLFVCVINYV